MLAVAVAALFASFAVGFELRSQSLAGPSPARHPAPLRSQVLADLESYYYRTLPPAAYRARTVAKMLQTLGDPYTRYLPPNAYSQLRAAESGTYPGGRARAPA